MQNLKLKISLKTLILTGFIICLASPLRSWGAGIEIAAQLEEHFNHAQTAYFNSVGSAQTILEFEKVANMANIANWSTSQKKLIHFSMLRLAQLSKDDDKIKSWIVTSFKFAPELRPDSDIFPPPLVQQYAKLSTPLIKRALVLPSQQNSEPDVTTTLPEPLETRPRWKNKWLWIGIGTLAAGYLIYENNRDEPQQATPHTTYGF